MKKLIIAAIILTLFFKVNSVRAQEIVSGSASLNSVAIYSYDKDYRSIRLESYLNSHNSPLSQYSSNIVYYSDVYNLDWRLIPAITGVESTFGKNIPSNSYNAYGWAGGKFYFKSWDDSIQHVSMSLKENYFDRGLTTTFKIARVYAPPSKTWAWKVNYFINQIDPNPIEFDL